MKLFSQFRKNSFLKSVSILSSGILIRQGLLFLGSPVISRLFLPSEMGDFTIIVSNYAIISEFLTLGLMKAIMLPKEAKKAQDICSLLLVSLSFFSTVFCLIMALIGDSVRVMNVAMPYPIACFCLWAYTISSLVNEIAYAYSNYQKMYWVMFWNPIICGTVNMMVTIFAGIMKWGVWGYSLGNISGNIIGIICIISRINPFRFSIKDIRDTIRENSRFLKYQWPANLIDTFSGQIPVQALSRIFGSGAVGSYSLCMKVLLIPVSLLANSINHIYYRKTAERINAGQEIGNFTYAILTRSVKFAILPVFLLMLFGKHLFVFAFGANWAEAGVMAANLGMGALMTFCARCVSGIYILIGKQNYNFLLSFFESIIISGTVLVARILGLGLMQTIFVYTCANVLSKVIMESIFFHIVGVSVLKYIRFVFVYIILPMLSCKMVQLFFSI